MSDFLMIISKKKILNLKDSIDLKLEEKIFLSEKILLKQEVAQKFKQDCCFFKKDSLHFSIDGVVLNLRDLKQKYNVDTVAKVLIKCNEKEADTFFDLLEGSFHGTIVNTELSQTTIFADALGNHPIYYYEDNDVFLFSNSILILTKQMKHLNKTPQLNKIGAYCMLTYAYMVGNHTIIEGIKRLIPGNYIQISNGVLEEKKYYELPSEIDKKSSDEELIQKIHTLFLEAMELQVLKNKEYGYINFTPLSGGLDSRMTVFALKELGVEDVVTFTYSETNQKDEEIPKRIARDLGFRWIFKSLDNGLDLMNIDEAIELSDMRCYYPWAAQLVDFLKYIDMDKVGLIHTGVIGDIVIGSFCHSYHQLKANYQIGDGAYSGILLNRLKELIPNVDNYNSYRDGMIYNRAYNGACLGYSTVFQRYTEALSPFMYRKLYDFCLSIPEDRRFQHNLYYKWVQTYFPEAAKYTHNGLKIHTSALNFKIKNKRIYFDTIPSRIKMFAEEKMKKNVGMNPLQQWYDSNGKLKLMMDRYFIDNLYVLGDDEELYNDVKMLYDHYSVMEKILSISLIGSIKQLMI